MDTHDMENRKNERAENIKIDKGRVYLRPTALQLSDGKKQIRIFSLEGSDSYFEELAQARLIMGQGHDIDHNDLRWLIV